MTKIATMVSNELNRTVEVQAYHTKIAHRLRVGLIDPDDKHGPIILSEDLFSANLISQISGHLDEFVVVLSGGEQSVKKEVRESDIFIDTGRRIQFNANLWGEVWRLRPEHFALMEKEESNEQTRSKNKSKH